MKKPPPEMYNGKSILQAPKGCPEWSVSVDAASEVSSKTQPPVNAVEEVHINPQFDTSASLMPNSSSSSSIFSMAEDVSYLLETAEESEDSEDDSEFE